MKSEELRCGEGLAIFIFLGCFVLGFSVQRGEVLVDYISSTRRLAGATAGRCK